MSGSDSLYSFRNNFYLGAYQALVDDHEIEGLTESEVLERDTIVHRSNLALGNYQVCCIAYQSISWLVLLIKQQLYSFMKLLLKLLDRLGAFDGWWSIVDHVWCAFQLLLYES